MEWSGLLSLTLCGCGSVFLDLPCVEVVQSAEAECVREWPDVLRLAMWEMVWSAESDVVEWSGLLRHTVCQNGLVC